MAYDDGTALCCMVLQAQSTQGQAENSEALTLTETWKGPWSQIKDVFKTQKIYDTTLIPAGKKPAFSNGKWQKQYTQPETPSTTLVPWRIQSYSISEGLGGNGFLTIQYAATKGSEIWNDYDPDAGERPTSSDTTPTVLSDDQLSTYEETESLTWTIEWMPYQRSMLEYSYVPQEIIKLKEFPGSQEWTYYDNSAKSQLMTFTTDNEERKIAKYYIKDIRPTFHYPVIHLHQEYTTPDCGYATGGGLDVKCNLPAGCPYQLDGWQWVKTGDQGSVKSSFNAAVFNVLDTKQATQKEVPAATKTYVRDQTWTGSKKVDEDLYGTNAWQPVDD